MCIKTSSAVPIVCKCYFFVDLVIKFEYIQYRRSESSSFTIRLVVNKVPASTFSVILYEEDDSAEGKCIACRVGGN